MSEIKKNPNETTESENNTEDKIDIEIVDEKPSKFTLKELEGLLQKEKQKLSSCEDNLKRSLADYRNLEKKTQLDIVNGVNNKLDQFMNKFLLIYDDFVRARSVLADEKLNVGGLDGILKNMNSLLSEYNITPIEALGEIFNPNLHEAISVVEDSDLDDGTITKEIRKGYICQNRIIRPSIVEISKKLQNKKSDGE